MMKCCGVFRGYPYNGLCKDGYERRKLVSSFDDSGTNVPRCYKHYIYGLFRRNFDSSRPSLSLVFKPVIMECADDLELNRDRLCVIYDSHNMYIRIYYFDEQLYHSDEESGGRRGPVKTSPRQLPYYDCCMEIHDKMKKLL